MRNRIINKLIPSEKEPYEKTHSLDPIGFFLAIVPEGQSSAVNALLAKQQAAFSFTTHGRGTATSEIYELLGLNENRKQIVGSLIPLRIWPAVKEKLLALFQISEYTKGVGVIINIASLSGVSLYRMITDRKDDEPKKGTSKVMSEQKAKATDNYQVIMAIVNEGYSTLVMDAAKKAGARGGTILNARGTGNKDMEQFFGIVISPEKEIILIVVPDKIKDDVLNSISKECGINTKGQGIAFALKASDAVGLVENSPETKKKQG